MNRDEYGYPLEDADRFRQSEDCWEPEDEGDLSPARGIVHGLMIMVLAACVVYIGIRAFDPDPFHEPLVEEVAP